MAGSIRGWLEIGRTVLYAHSVSELILAPSVDQPAKGMCRHDDLQRGRERQHSAFRKRGAVAGRCGGGGPAPKPPTDTPGGFRTRACPAHYAGGWNGGDSC